MKFKFGYTLSKSVSERLFLYFEKLFSDKQKRTVAFNLKKCTEC